MCGVVGVYHLEGDAPILAARGLYKLQHRGELGAGLTASSGGVLKDHRGMGLVTDVFTDEAIFSKHFGVCRAAIGHTRYATTEEKQQRRPLNLQPIIGDFHGEPFAVSHNGNLIFLEKLKGEVEEGGYHFQTTVDTEVIVGLLSEARETDFIEALAAALPRLTGSFSLTILYRDMVIAARDGNGIRPLCIGRGDNFFMVASESCAFETMGANLVRSVRPGEIVVIDRNGIRQPPIIWHENPRLKICIFEYIYFARPDSVIEGQSVYMVRKRLGRTVAREHPVEADIVVPIPDSGKIYAYGIAEELALPIEEGIIRDRYYPKRTFLEPREVDRRALQRFKFAIVRKAVHDKRVIVAEDSIVRANVTPEVVAMLREQGAREVHLRVGSSPIRHPCYFGIDMATYGELIAASFSIDEIRKYIQADTLGYTSMRGMLEAIGLPEENISYGCFSGEYPVCPFESLSAKS